MMMQALVYTGPNTVEYRAVPKPVPALGEALVAVEAVGICGSDMHAYHGHDERRPPPLILGHEAAGHVLNGALAGKRVTINPLVVDPACPRALEGRSHLSPTRQILSMPPRPGAFAQFVCVPERNLVVVPDGLALEKAALAEPLAVSLHAVRRGIALLYSPLSTVRCLVQGAGAIGVGAVLALAMEGATDITLVEPNEKRREAAMAMGLAQVVSPAMIDPATQFDLIIDAVGAVATRRDATRLARPGGAIVHVGLLPGLDGLDVRRLTLQEITVTGSYCYTHAEFTEVVNAMALGLLGPLDWYVTRPLSEAEQAFDDLDSGRCAAPKVVLKP